MDLHSDTRTYLKRVLIAAGLLALLAVALYLIEQLALILLVIFAGVLLALLLDGLAGLVQSHTRLPRGWALALVIVLLTGLIAGAGWFAGPRLSDQFAELTERIPEAVRAIESEIRSRPWGERLIENNLSTRELLPSNSTLIGGITGVFSSFLDVLGNILIILFIGMYVAVSPDDYRTNLLYLVPARYRDRLGEVMSAQGKALQRWLAGRFASMVIVGVLTAIGLWVIGVPLALTLGLIAAVFSFVPYIGPVIAAIPAVLIGALQGMGTAGTVALVYLIVQLIESYLITPLIQQRAVSLPPALLITVQVVMGVLFGAVGVLFATPFAVAVIVAVQMLYVQDVLGDDVAVLGTANSEK